MSEDNGNGSTSVEISKGGVKFSGKKTSEFINVILAIGVILGGYILWKHDTRAEKQEIAVVSSMDSVASSQKFFACIISQPQDERMKQFENPNSFCNRFSK